MRAMRYLQMTVLWYFGEYSLSRLAHAHIMPFVAGVALGLHRPHRSLTVSRSALGTRH